eukprot:gene24449-26249_t
MKKILAAIFMMLVPAVTQAADFATTRASVIEGSANPIALWTGLYLGAQLGVLTDKSSTTCTTGQNCSLDIVWENTANTQFSGGIYAGYNVQFGRGVVGIEADANMNNGTASMSYASGINATSYGYVIHSDYSASVRARAGFLMTDRLLAYGTG